MCDKAIKKVKHNLIEKVKKIQKPVGNKTEWKAIHQYNLMLSGVHNYYKMATHISHDMRDIGRNVDTAIKNRLRDRVKRTGSLKKYKYIEGKYGKSKQLKFVSEKPLIPVAYIKTRPPMLKKTKVNCYTTEGRKEIHKPLNVSMKILQWLVHNQGTQRSIEYMDNRISLFAGQNGQCAIMGEVLETDEIHCHHKRPVKMGGTDEYKNLLIIHTDVHILIHAKDEKTIEKCMILLKLDKSQLAKINKYRKLVKNPEI